MSNSRGVEPTKQPAIDDALMQEIARRIVEAVSPERVILFGSRARGDARPDSDVDLFVEWDTLGHPRQQRTQDLKPGQGRC